MLVSDGERAANPGYATSGAACADLVLEMRQFMCFGGDACEPAFRSQGIRELVPIRD
jgi:hypothetical protein